MSYAFYGCISLVSLNIPNNVISIGDDAFRNCSKITDIVIPDSVTGIGNYAFYNCNNLKSVTIGNGVTRIGNYAFYYCPNITSVVFENSEDWKYYCNSTSVSGTELPRSLSDASTAASCLKTHSQYYWKRG